jgi:16S rRNA processing protein RimM
MKEADKLVLVAEVGGAHGVKGEVRITTYTEDPLALLTYATLLDTSGNPCLTLSGGRPSRTGIVARCKSIDTREQAEALRGLKLHVRRSRLPAPQTDEFYLADLVGLRCLGPDGTDHGLVRDVANFGAGDLLEIAPSQGAATWYLSFTKDNVPEIDFESGQIIIVKPAEIE